LWRYVGKYAAHVRTVSIEAKDDHLVSLPTLPANLQLHSLQLQKVGLAPALCDRVLGAAASVAALKQLRLWECKLSGDNDCLAAALSVLPTGLQYLSLNGPYFCIVGYAPMGAYLTFPANVLQQLQQLTYLELEDIEVEGPGQGSPDLQPLQALTRLVDLRLRDVYAPAPEITANMLSGMHHLTRLELFLDMELEPAVLAGKTHLQYLRWQVDCSDDNVHAAQLLSHLQPLQQLTHLDLYHSLLSRRDGPPARAYSALTASSKLQYLDISGCILPPDAFQHVFPAGRDLRHL
jgi:hypothetical protein